MCRNVKEKSYLCTKSYLLKQGVLRGIWNLTTTATSYYSAYQKATSCAPLTRGGVCWYAVAEVRRGCYTRETVTIHHRLPFQ